MKTKSISILLICICLLIGYSANSQSIKKSKLKFSGFAQKKFNDADKKIFIEQFSINYQYIYAKTKKKRGGRQLGGGYLGNAKAALFLGLGDLDPTKLQEITDNTYQQFTTKLREKGFTILTGDVYKNHAYFKKGTPYKGGTPSEFFQGFISTSPTGVTFINSKRGVFNTTLSTSKNLDGVIVARVNIMIPFAEDGESQASKGLGKMLGGIAKVVAKPNLRIGKTSIQTKSKLGFDKHTLVSSYVDFGYKKGLKYQASHRIDVKKAIEIQNVLPTKKYKAVKTANQDLNGVQVGHYKVFNVPSAELKKMQTLKFDTNKYYRGVTEGVNYYMNSATNKFISHIK